MTEAHPMVKIIVGPRSRRLWLFRGILLAFLFAFSKASGESPTKLVPLASTLGGQKNGVSKIDLAVILNELRAKGYGLIDLEQGQFSPQFDRDLEGPDYLKSLKDLLATQDYAYELHGTVMVIYDKKLRGLGADKNPLNLNISSVKLSNVSLEECFKKIGELLHIKIYYGDTIAFTRVKPATNFNIELNNITLRDALFEIASKSGCQIWNAYVFMIGDRRVLQISIK